jgi:hypothetical protein
MILLKGFEKMIDIDIPSLEAILNFEKNVSQRAAT